MRERAHQLQRASGDRLDLHHGERTVFVVMNPLGMDASQHTGVLDRREV